MVMARTATGDSAPFKLDPSARTKRLDAEYLPYNPELSRVATSLAETIVAAKRDLQVEHIGSTAIAGCWGKGIIDLLVLYRPGNLESARAALDRLKFQRQSGPEPFPESRPMRVGNVEYFGRMLPRPCPCGRERRR